MEMIESFLNHLYMFVVVVSLCMKPGPEIHLGIYRIGAGILCKETERQVLLKIKHDLVDNYGHLSSWGTEQDNSDCCKWSGITCSNQTGRIKKLDLSASDGSRPLRGKINQSLLELNYLTYLDSSNNDFGGSRFPDNRNGSFMELRYLSLRNAKFGGIISSMLANLSSLQSLDLSYNYFVDLGKNEWLASLSTLTCINFHVF